MNHARKQSKAKRSSAGEGEEVPIADLAASPGALDFALAATPRVLALQREPACRLILETNSALAGWEDGGVGKQRLT